MPRLPVIAAGLGRLETKLAEIVIGEAQYLVPKSKRPQ
jgi:hypothetical protein